MLVVALFGCIAALLVVLVVGSSSEADGGVAAAAPAGSGAVEPSKSSQVEPVVPSASEEVVSARSEFSRTYRRTNGARRTVIFATPVNYRDRQDAWQPIDTGLVADGSDGLQTAGSPVQVTAPTELGDGEVRVGDDQRWVAFALDGASGSASVSGSTATYEDAVGSTDASMTATTTGVKETLTIEDADAPTRYRYALSTSQGLSTRSRPDGSVAVIDAHGSERFVIPAPTVQEASGEPTTDHVQFSLSSDGSQLTVSVDPAWLAHAKLPVQVDPTVYDGAAITACNLAGGSLASTSDCSSALLKAGFDGSRARRFALRWTSLAANGIPVGAAIDYAQMGLTFESMTNSSAHPQLDVAALGHSVASGATWNTYNGSAAWTTAGGDLDASAPKVQPLPWGDNFVGDPQEPLGWDVSGLVQSWLRDPSTNHGMLVRAHDESVNNIMSFDSPTGTHQGPYLAIDWRTRPGRERDQTHEAQTESATSQLAVNVVSGNLDVTGNDVHLPGVGGLDLDVRRDYNSGDFADQHLSGSAWATTVNGAALDLESHFLSNGHTLMANGGAIYRFDRDTTADTTVGGVLIYGYKTPPNFDGTMRQSSATDVTTVTLPNGTAWTYKDGDFYGQVLTQIKDAAGHHIDLTYNPLWGSNGQALTKITDTNGHDLTVTRTTPAGTVTGLTDSTGHHWTWNISSSNHYNLNSVTDPSPNTQSYTYTTTIPTIWDQLKKITTNNRQTTITYGNGTTARADQVTGVSTVIGTASAVTTTFNYNPSSSTGHACDPVVTASPYPDNHVVGRTVETDNAGRVTTYCYNTGGQVIQSWRPWDTTAPTITGTPAPFVFQDGYTNGVTPFVVGLSASDTPSGVKRVALEEVGQGELTSATSPCAPATTMPNLCPASFSSPVTINPAPLAAGAHVIRQTATDLAGNVATSATWNLFVDRTAPSPPTGFDQGLFYPDDADHSVTITWADSTDPALPGGAAGAGELSYDARYSINGGAFTVWAPAESNSIVIPSAAVGNVISIEARAIDAVGNVSTVGSGSRTIVSRAEDPALDTAAATAYAADYGTTQAVAAAWMVVQDRADPLGQQIADSASGPGYGGVWYDNINRKYVADIKTGTSTTAAQTILTNAGLTSSNSRIDMVGYTQNELDNAYIAMEPGIQDLIDTYIIEMSRDTEHNAIHIEVGAAATTAQRNRVTAAVAAASVPVTVTNSSASNFAPVYKSGCAEGQPPRRVGELDHASLCDPPLRGGTTIYADGSNGNESSCTGGFVAYAAGAHYLLTAGHCLDGLGGSSAWSTYDSYRVRFDFAAGDSYVFDKRGDAGIVRVDANEQYSDVRPWVYISGRGDTRRATQYRIRSVNYSLPLAATSPQKAYVCMSGARSGGHCGEVVKTAVGSQRWGVVNICRPGQSDKILSGDSGGPVVKNGQARGLISNALANDECHPRFQSAKLAMGLLDVSLVPPPGG